jgi:hypothetical protein
MDLTQLQALALDRDPDAAAALAREARRLRDNDLLLVALCCGAPDPTRWDALCRLIDAHPRLLHGDRRAAADHMLSHWPDALRVMQRPKRHRLRLVSPVRHLLRALDLSHMDIQNLCGLELLTHLTILKLNKTQVTDLSAIAHLTRLTTLDLSETPVSDLRPLQNLPHLTTLHLDYTQVTDLSPLQNLPHLQTLSLWYTQVTDLSPLQNLTRLKDLYLWQTPVSDLSPLQNLPHLTTHNIITAPDLPNTDDT